MRRIIPFLACIVLALFTAFPFGALAEDPAVDTSAGDTATLDTWDKVAAAVSPVPLVPTPVAGGTIPCGIQPGGLCGGLCPDGQGCGMVGTECKCTLPSCKDTDPNTTGLQCGGICVPGQVCALKALPNGTQGCLCQAGIANCEMTTSEGGQVGCAGTCSSGACKLKADNSGCECGSTCEATFNSQGALVCGGVCPAGSACVLSGEACTCKPVNDPCAAATAECFAKENVAPQETCSGLPQRTIPLTSEICQRIIDACKAQFQCPAGCVVQPGSEQFPTKCTFVDEFIDKCSVAGIAKCMSAGGSGGNNGGTGPETSCPTGTQPVSAVGNSKNPDGGCNDGECGKAGTNCERNLAEQCRSPKKLTNVAVSPDCNTVTESGRDLCRRTCTGCCG